MATIRTLTLTPAQQQELTDLRDRTKHEYIRERCAALLKIAVVFHIYNTSDSFD
jgi:hypothetical protein